MSDLPEWTLRITREADGVLKKLDKAVAQRLLKKLQWLSQSKHPAKLLKPLKENRSGQHSLRIQEYRAILEIMEDERILVVIEVGHRKNVYD